MLPVPVVAVPWRCRGGVVAVSSTCRGGVMSAPSRRCLVAWEWRASLQPRPPRPARPRLGRPFPDTIPGRTTRAWRPRQSYNRGVWPLGAGSPRCQPLVRPLRRASSAGDVDYDCSLAGERGERQRRAVDLGAGESVQACGRWHASGDLIAVRSRYCVPRSQERSPCASQERANLLCVPRRQARRGGSEEGRARERAGPPPSRTAFAYAISKNSLDAQLPGPGREVNDRTPSAPSTSRGSRGGYPLAALGTCRE